MQNSVNCLEGISWFKKKVYHCENYW